uniref:3-oxo-5-alpha-steroid 4-dehydrogenase C-terminal domain-containing protein n=1 Tax=Anopheles merus TaxID=30066 RepID=A0A182UUV5_ANOME
MATNKRMVRTTPTETMVVMTLITLQCLRLVFSSKLKITHQWYVENFHNYPKQRKALVPFVLHFFINNWHSYRRTVGGPIAKGRVRSNRLAGHRSDWLGQRSA